MARNLSITAFKKQWSKHQRVKAATQRARAKAGQTMETALSAGIIAGSAYALGVIQEAYKKSSKPGGPLEAPEIFGIPLSIAVAAGAHTAAFMGTGKGMEKHFVSVGNGALAVYAATAGQGRGLEMRQKRVTEGTSGMLGATGQGQRYSEQEVDEYASFD